ncbi:hypothetical protein [Pyrococcus kukulkanii]|uniref:hypothetical protein n=1 Tax=Pyrococcus kukulkanii TaxID=1609559 RepID=UPI00356AD30E
MDINNGTKNRKQRCRKVHFDLDLVLSKSTYSYWTIGINVGPFIVLSVSKGEHFEGWKLDVSYDSTGAGKIYFAISSGNNPPRITKIPKIWTSPENVEWKRKWIQEGGKVSAIVIKQSQHDNFMSESSLSIPIGAGAGKYLSSLSPTLGRLANTLSITIGFHKCGSTSSRAKYLVDIVPRRNCYAMYSVFDVELKNESRKVIVPLIFGIITDGKSPLSPCNPKTGLCPTSIEES